MKSLWLHSKVFRISKTSWFAEKVMRLTQTCPYNNIPRIGEEVIIKNKWYLVEKIINRYKELTNSTFTDVYVYLKELEE